MLRRLAGSAGCGTDAACPSVTLAAGQSVTAHDWKALEHGWCCSQRCVVVGLLTPLK